MGLFSAQLHVLLALHTQSPGSKGSCFKPSKNPRRLSSSLLCFNWPFEKREGLGEDSALVSRKPHEYLLWWAGKGSQMVPTEDCTPLSSFTPRNQIASCFLTYYHYHYYWVLFKKVTDLSLLEKQQHTNEALHSTELCPGRSWTTSPPRVDVFYI